MRLVLLGAPGSGKGTQAQSLVKRYKVPQISTGDLLRAAVSQGTELGKKAKQFMDAGQLVPDSIVLGMIKERLSRPDADNGFILDGFPRNVPQAEALDKMLAQMKQPLDTALLIDVDYDILMQRLTGRLTCESCGAVFNIYTNPPSQEEACDLCGGKLHHRADDNEETIGNRLRVYDAQTKPLVEHYGKSDHLDTVVGEGDIKEIFSKICAVIDKRMPEDEPKLPAPKEEAKLPAPKEEAKLPAPKDKPKLVKPAAKKAVKKAATKKKAAKKKPAPKAATPKKPAAKKSAAKPAVKKAVKKKPARKAAKKPVITAENVHSFTGRLIDAEMKAMAKLQASVGKEVDRAAAALQKTEDRWAKKIAAAEAKLEKLEARITGAATSKKGKKGLIGRMVNKVKGKQSARKKSK